MTDTIAISAIPHRPPFLFVDRVVELANNRIVTTKHADPEAEFFRGHYPGDPIMPGVLICECCFQAGALLIAHVRGGLDASDGTPVLTRIQDARFKRVVRPGDVLQVEVTIDDVLDDAYFMTGRVTMDGKAVVRVTFACTQVQAKEP